MLVKPQPAPVILSQESVHTTLSITHHTRKRPSTGPRNTHGPHRQCGTAPDTARHERSIGPHRAGPLSAGLFRASVGLGPGDPFGNLYSSSHPNRPCPQSSLCPSPAPCPPIRVRLLPSAAADGHDEARDGQIWRRPVRSRPSPRLPQPPPPLPLPPPTLTSSRGSLIWRAGGSTNRRRRVADRRRAHLLLWANVAPSLDPPVGRAVGEVGETPWETAALDVGRRPLKCLPSFLLHESAPASRAGARRRCCRGPVPRANGRMPEGIGVGCCGSCSGG
jgi:hypothetical protein